MGTVKGITGNEKADRLAKAGELNASPLAQNLHGFTYVCPTGS